MIQVRTTDSSKVSHILLQDPTAAFETIEHNTLLSFCCKDLKLPTPLLPGSIRTKPNDCKNSFLTASQQPVLLRFAMCHRARCWGQLHPLLILNTLKTLSRIVMLAPTSMPMTIKCTTAVIHRMLVTFVTHLARVLMLLTSLLDVCRVARNSAKSRPKLLGSARRRAYASCRLMTFWVWPL